MRRLMTCQIRMEIGVTSKCSADVTVKREEAVAEVYGQCFVTHPATDEKELERREASCFKFAISTTMEEDREVCEEVMVYDVADFGGKSEKGEP